MYKHDSGSNRVEQLKDNYLPSNHPTFLSSKSAPIPTFPQKGRRVCHRGSEAIRDLNRSRNICAMTGIAQEAGSKNKDLLNDKSLSSYPPTFLSSRPAPTQPPSKGRSNVAFTLAEVLITLGIIGVVAALTLPALIQNYKRSQTTAQLKKFYSMMSQAVQMAEANEGLKTYEWDEYSNRFTNITNKESADAHNDYIYNYWNKYLAPYFKTLKVEKGAYDEENSKNIYPKVYLNDGSYIILLSGDAIDIQYDVNGDKGPNKYGIDKFPFFIATKTTIPVELPKGHSFGVGYMNIYNTREKALAICASSPYNCSTLLYYDNFEFKDDYPYKL